MKRGWSINVGGGFHHCSSDSGGGFCVYADITLLIRHLFQFYSEEVQRLLIVDLDAHQVHSHSNAFFSPKRSKEDLFLFFQG